MFRLLRGLKQDGSASQGSRKAAADRPLSDRIQFRQDKALALLLGHELPAAQTARDFLAPAFAPDADPSGSIPAWAGKPSGSATPIYHPKVVGKRLLIARSRIA